MRQVIMLALVVLLVLAVQGCDETVTKSVPAESLSPPLGLKSITGHEEITLLWYTSNYEDDLNGYHIHQGRLSIQEQSFQHHTVAYHNRSSKRHHLFIPGGSCQGRLGRDKSTVEYHQRHAPKGNLGRLP